MHTVKSAKLTVRIWQDAQLAQVAELRISRDMPGFFVKYVVVSE
ncbi:MULTISPECIES: hypothetical protein [unclassified Nocardia]|nr:MULTISPECIES: hypothetical protein [unclassified Nocardia]